MKHHIKIAALTIWLAVSTVIAMPQKPYRYDTVPGDPLKARMYRLDNGLKVYLSVYKDAPRVQTAVAIRTGSKNDPAGHTGISHYLEHMMFKGSDEFGTRDYAAEKVYLDQIEQLFEEYSHTRDEARRSSIYRRIDSLSGIAATFAIANEYDKLLAVIGAKGTNAFTSFDETIYINDIPSVKIRQWLDIEKERFQDPVFRLFHTELETVYEEKNMSLDSDDDNVFDSLFSGLFPTHTYGTQTTLGTAEHLKNPSLTALKRYYRSRYVPNNMAVVLSGDFDPDEVIRWIDETFGKLQPVTVQPWVPAIEKPLKGPVIKEVSGPEAGSVTIGFRFSGAASHDADLLTVLNMILSNETAGLMDLNLNQAQKVLKSEAFSYILKDYSVHILSGEAKEGQTLEEVKQLVMDQIEMVKRGEFPEWMIAAVVNQIKYKEIKEQESNFGRALAMANEFIQELPVNDRVGRLSRLSRITRQEIIDFARRNYSDNYVVVYKRTGAVKESARVVKPAITPVTMNRDDESAFLKKIMSAPETLLEPVFLDFSKDISHYTAKGAIPVLYRANTENATFSLAFQYDMGTCNSREIALALDYLPFLGTSRYTPRQLKEEFYRLACSYQVYSGEDEIRITLTGLSDNMIPALGLLEHIFADVAPNHEALVNMIADLKKLRSDDKLSKESILWQGMLNYGIYGERSPFTNVLSDDQLDAAKADQLVRVLRELPDYKHEILYYGPEPPKKLLAILDKEHQVTLPLKSKPEAQRFSQRSAQTSGVYTVDYDMKQAEILMVSTSVPYNKDMAPAIRLFNEYFGGSMNSVVFQEIREARGLAYSAFAGYRSPVRPDQNYYLFAYIGTQNDKLPEAMKAMLGLFQEMPESVKALESSKDAIINRIRTERITRDQVLYYYLNARKFGLKEDIRREVFARVPSMTPDDLRSFQQQYLRDKKFTILVLGNEEELDRETLRKYGNISTLDLRTLFGY